MNSQTSLLRTGRVSFLRRCCLLSCKLLVLTFSLAWISCSGSDDYDLFASLYGRVTDVKSGEPVVNACVMLIPSGISAQPRDVESFVFYNLNVQQNTILEQNNDYHTNRKAVTAISGKTLQVNIPFHTSCIN